MGILNSKIKNDTEIFYLFGNLPIYQKPVKKPVFDEDTIFVWEPCTHNHAEVVPGYVKYLLDLGHKVSVLVSQVPDNEGLFSRFQHENLTVNKLTKKETAKYFKHYGLGNAKGLMITTGAIERDGEFKFSENAKNGQKILKVEHSMTVFDNIPKDEKIITLREMQYQGATSIGINPHYFGDVKITDKNDMTNFIVIGALRKKRRNASLLVDAVEKLHDKGITNFKITVIGKGSLSNVPRKIRKYFDIKGRLCFGEMYKEMENADFFLPLLDVENPQHEDMITTKTSGSFQLIYGFLTPTIMAEKFAPVNGYTDENSILHKTNSDLADAMEKGIVMSKSEYKTMQNKLSEYTNELYNRSLENMRRLINE